MLEVSLKANSFSFKSGWLRTLVMLTWFKIVFVAKSELFSVLWWIVSKLALLLLGTISCNWPGQNSYIMLYSCTCSKVIMFYFLSKDFAILYNNSWYNTERNHCTKYSVFKFGAESSWKVSMLVVVCIGHVHLGHRYFIQKMAFVVKCGLPSVFGD